MDNMYAPRQQPQIPWLQPMNQIGSVPGNGQAGAALMKLLMMGTQGSGMLPMQMTQQNMPTGSLFGGGNEQR